MTFLKQEIQTANLHRTIFVTFRHYIAFPFNKKNRTVNKYKHKNSTHMRALPPHSNLYCILMLNYTHIHCALYTTGTPNNKANHI